MTTTKNKYTIPSEFKGKSLRIGEKTYSNLTFISKGSIGWVYKAATSLNNENRLVVLKIARSQYTEKIKSNFEIEKDLLEAFNGEYAPEFIQFATEFSVCEEEEEGEELIERPILVETLVDNQEYITLDDLYTKFPGKVVPDRLALLITWAYLKALKILHENNRSCRDRKMGDIHWRWKEDYTNPDKKWEAEPAEKALQILDWNVLAKDSDRNKENDLRLWGRFLHSLILGYKPRVRNINDEIRPIWDSETIEDVQDPNLRAILIKTLYPELYYDPATTEEGSESESFENLLAGMITSVEALYSSPNPQSLEDSQTSEKQGSGINQNWEDIKQDIYLGANIQQVTKRLEKTRPQDPHQAWQKAYWLSLIKAYNNKLIKMVDFKALAKLDVTKPLLKEDSNAIQTVLDISKQPANESFTKLSCLLEILSNLDKLKKMVRSSQDPDTGEAETLKGKIKKHLDYKEDALFKWLPYILPPDEDADGLLAQLQYRKTTVNREDLQKRLTELLEKLNSIPLQSAKEFLESTALKDAYHFHDAVRDENVPAPEDDSVDYRKLYRTLIKTLEAQIRYQNQREASSLYIRAYDLNEWKKQLDIAMKLVEKLPEATTKSNLIDLFDDSLRKAIKSLRDTLIKLIDQPNPLLGDALAALRFEVIQKDTELKKHVESRYSLDAESTEDLGISDIGSLQELKKLQCGLQVYQALNLDLDNLDYELANAELGKQIEAGEELSEELSQVCTDQSDSASTEAALLPDTTGIKKVIEKAKKESWTFIGVKIEDLNKGISFLEQIQELLSNIQSDDGDDAPRQYSFERENFKVPPCLQSLFEKFITVIERRFREKENNLNELLDSLQSPDTLEPLLDQETQSWVSQNAQNINQHLTQLRQLSRCWEQLRKYSADAPRDKDLTRSFEENYKRYQGKVADFQLQKYKAQAIKLVEYHPALAVVFHSWGNSLSPQSQQTEGEVQ